MITLTAIPTLIQSGSYNIFQEYSWAILLFITGIPFVVEFLIACLLYTSDAADEL